MQVDMRHCLQFFSPNILLNLHWVAKLSDFGLAQQATSGTVSGQYTQATIAEFGGKMEYGSYEYIPEEVWESQGHVSTKTDVFSLGVVSVFYCFMDKHIVWA